MAQRTDSTWNFYGTQKGIESSIALSTVYDRSNPVSISFRCSRSVSWMDERMSRVFQNAIFKKAHLDMTKNHICSHNQVTGGCGNRRGYLSECRCEVLDRISHPDVRTNYENRVIKTIFHLLSNTTGPFHFKLAIFCSGELLGEQVLLFRLLDKLKKENATGIIELFLIDHCYKHAIENSTHTDKFEDCVGREKCIEQFLIEIGQCLPQSISIRGSFFASSEQYIQMAQNNDRLKHHLLIVADIENSNFDMGQIGEKAGCGLANPIALIKTDAPAVCELDSVGHLTNCYNPSGGARPAKRNNNNLPLALGIGGGLAVAATLLTLSILLNSRSKHAS